MPSEVVRAIENIVACGRECIVKKEHGLWIVIENNRRVVYRETKREE